jgi:hypothetical protein
MTRGTHPDAGPAADDSAERGVGYQVQGRCAGRDVDEQDNVRLVSTADRAAAFAAAAAMVGAGFTAWVFEVGGRRSYRLVEMLRPPVGRS